jgi:hypothetical protein
MEQDAYFRQVSAKSGTLLPTGFELAMIDLNCPAAVTLTTLVSPR